MDLEFKLYRSVCNLADVRDCYESFGGWKLQSEVMNFLDYLEDNDKEDWFLDLLEKEFEGIGAPDMDALLKFIRNNVQEWSDEFGI